jgi:hypothetical protein
VGSAAGECAAQYKALGMHDHLLEPDAELVRTAVAEHKRVQLSVVGDSLSWLRLRDPGACICQCTYQELALQSRVRIGHISCVSNTAQPEMPFSRGSQCPNLSL